MAAAANESNIPSWVVDVAKDTNPPPSNASDRNKRLAAFNNRKGLKNRLKNRKKNKKGQKARRQRGNGPSAPTTQRIHRKDVNYGFNNDLSDQEEDEIFRSLSRAVSMHNKLSDDELLKIFQRALRKLNAAWFRENICSFFKPIAADPSMGDVVSFILRLFVLNFELNNTRHNVPFRYLLLDLIAPSLHARHSARGNAMLIQPLPEMTNFHRAAALEIFSLWILEMTRDIDAADWSVAVDDGMDSKEDTHDDPADGSHPITDSNDVDSKSTDDDPVAAPKSSNPSNLPNPMDPVHSKEISLDLLSKYTDRTLSFLRAKEMECLFHAFALDDILPHRIRTKLCDKVHHLLFHEHAAPKAIEWTLYFELTAQIPYQLILAPVLKQQSELHYALNYVDSLSTKKKRGNLRRNCGGYKEEVKRFIVSCISGLMAKNETNISANRAMKLIEIWKFNLEDFEPLVVRQIQTFLRWTIYKGHIDDYAECVCSHSAVLKRWVIEQCHHHSTTYKSCVHWAEHWGMDEEEGLKPLVQHSREWLSKHSLDADAKLYAKRKKETFNGFIKGFDDLDFFDVELDCIVFVDDAATLEVAKAVLLDDAVDAIGLDLELMSVELPIPDAPAHCQIIQIATAERAFIFDLQRLDELEGWDDLFADVFESEAVKVGMAWQGDLCNLKKQWPDSIAFKAVCAPYLELQTVAKHIRTDGEFLEKQPEWMVLDEDKEKKIKNRMKRDHAKEGGLAKYVRWVLRKRLNKHEQLSNWSRRPLRPEQLKYAALDSIVECHLWRQFKEWEQQTVLPDLEGFYEDLYGQTN